MSTAGNYTWPKRKQPVVAEQPKRRYLLWIIGAMMILLLSGLGIAWATGYFDPDPRITEIRNLRAQLADKSLTDEQRRALGEQVRKKYRDLPADLQASLEKDHRRKWDSSHEVKRLNELFAMSPADREAALKKDVEEMYRQQQERDKRHQQRDAAAANQAPADSASGSGSGGSGSGQGGQSSGQGGGRGSRRSMTDDQRTALSKRYVENSPPEARAARAVYGAMLQQQAQQMGLPLKMGRAIVGR